MQHPILFLGFLRLLCAGGKNAERTREGGEGQRRGGEETSIDADFVLFLFVDADGEDAYGMRLELTPNDM